MPVDFAFSVMARQSDRCPAPWRRPFIRWIEGVEAGWAVPLLLLCFVVVWTLALSIAYVGSGLHPDVLETWTLGRHFSWGSVKHPPLMGWVTGAWSSIFPSTNWSLQLMAMSNAALALWLVDLISRQFVTGHKRLIVLLLLMLTPAYQFHAQRFNANAVLLVPWPLATYCYLRAFETRTALWAIAAGVTAALSMLGKYYSIFLVASFVLAAIAHPSRRAYFTTAAPWISVATGLIALSPHIFWLIKKGAPPFSYALAHAHTDLATSLREVASFLAGLAAAMSVPAITWAMIAGYRLRRLGHDFAALNAGLRLLLYIALGSIALPIVTAVVVGTDLPSLWALQGLFLFVVVAVCSTRYRIERFYTVNTTVLVACIAAVAVVIAAPIHALYRNSYGYQEGRTFYPEAANELTRLWRELTGVPLAVVDGNESLGFAVAFYSPDHPQYARAFAYQYGWKLPNKVAMERGWAALCFQDQIDCLAWMHRTALQAENVAFVRRVFTVQSDLLGLPGLKRNIVALMAVRRPCAPEALRAQNGMPTDETPASSDETQPILP
ncbi:glycosyltransferase family 39 protein [Bradyrhizobium sp. SZCCHNR1070]|uniref:glycosyltransferase family 39 protein n=1 Tax=Bradyrhizobium sp. SZCCHNR1070 TaxID=3057361 RepID=UPI00291636A4|nr:glycosyltransferase family 39 protein [Bradyrhizobium sp. SZCCHNR1070]